CMQVDTVPYELASKDDLIQTQEMVEAHGRCCLAVQADVRDFQQMQELANRAIREFGKIDILISNAGIASASLLAEMSEQMWRDMIDTNLTGQFNTVRAVIPHMIQHQYGRIIVISSQLGLTGGKTQGHYAAAKHGIIGLVETLAIENADKGITVNAICPTTVDTAMVHNEALYKAFGANPPTYENALKAFPKPNAIPVPWIEPQEVSNLLMFLVSDEARYITGAAHRIDAGSLASAVSKRFG
ncbi:MAG: mycofactocin-coupled SDR family oxidoreductase, partial [Chroococcidiopsidaceae cyanobacterium CP_BM_ER_R8_30]|nr:mycofactocin-coupled SDR family oxidoreductase [Chroococcidiopsidaceae cyanobacterium CP_BM_ER_R8_30]